MGYKITIDGPAGTGKGTLAKELARILNIINIDSGALYRACGLYVLRNNIDTNNIKDIEKALNELEIELRPGKAGMDIYINDENVSTLIRDEKVAEMAAKVSKLKNVREYVLKRQRALAKGRNIIMEGRDIGSVVFPEAEIKIFLTADVEERAKRRYNELVEKGKNTSFDIVYNQIMARDKEDSTREISPLKKTDDMIEIDTTNLTINQVVEEVKGLIREKGFKWF